MFDKALSKIVSVTKFAQANLELKISAAKLLKSREVMYLPWLWLLSLFSISVTLVLWCVITRLLTSGLSLIVITRLLTSGILFSAVVNAIFVTKLLTVGILPSISVILVL